MRASPPTSGRGPRRPATHRSERRPVHQHNKTCARLGVRWMANMGAQSLSSPIVAYNQTLGQTVVYAGTEGGWFTAYSELTGNTLWSVNIGTTIRSTPIVHGSSIWVVGTYSPRLLKLDAATGGHSARPARSTRWAKPVRSLPHLRVVSRPSSWARLIWLRTAPCTPSTWPTARWHRQNAPYPVGGGVWDFMSYAVDAPTTAFPNGEPLVLFGTCGHRREDVRARHHHRSSGVALPDGGGQ